MLETVAMLLVIGGLGLLGYTVLGYPLILMLLGTIIPTHSPARYTDSDAFPDVTLVVPVHNEADVIERKAANIREMEYPGEFQCLFVSDSNDGTNEIIQNIMDDRMALLSLPTRRGKSHAINQGIHATETDVVVLSDANTFYRPNTVTKLVEPLHDESVGCVTGRLDLRDSGGGSGEIAYWRYELWLRRLESRLGTTVSVNGGVMALRRSDVQPLSTDSLTDDFVLAIEQALAGRRIYYTPDALATENAPGSPSAEFTRRVRIGAGNYQVMVRYPELLDPRRGVISFQYFSHKLLRWLLPWLLLAIAAGTIGLVVTRGSLIAQMLLAVQLGGYALAAVGWIEARFRSFAIVRLSTYFVIMNFALAIGCLRMLSGETEDIWKKTERQS